ncbi:hypothetical protein DFH09DRAFT_1076117 [Mycena vulgaris]|nr:hypothetical protein DFH09DRAFT_1076117 [Mycena vulgaris]
MYHRQSARNLRGHAVGPVVNARDEPDPDRHATRDESRDLSASQASCYLMNIPGSFAMKNDKYKIDGCLSFAKQFPGMPPWEPAVRPASQAELAIAGHGRIGRTRLGNFATRKKLLFQAGMLKLILRQSGPTSKSNQRRRGAFWCFAIGRASRAARSAAKSLSPNRPAVMWVLPGCAEHSEVRPAIAWLAAGWQTFANNTELLGHVWALT